MSDEETIREAIFTNAEKDMPRAYAALEALVSRAEAAEAERDEAQLRAGMNGLGMEPSGVGGPGKEEAYWQRRKLDAAIRHLRDIEDYFRLAGGVAESPNMIRADRARAIYEQISDDYLNGKTYRPTMKERAEGAEADRDRLRGELAYAIECGSLGVVPDWSALSEEDQDEWIAHAKEES